MAEAYLVPAGHRHRVATVLPGVPYGICGLFPEAWLWLGGHYILSQFCTRQLAH